MSERVIKFRAKVNDPNNLMYNQWLYFTLKDAYYSDEIIVTKLDWSTLSQFTGLHDKNGKGKEIYHKDILKWTTGAEWDSNVPVERHGIVEWHQDGWMLQEIENPSESDGLGIFLYDHPDAEVCGDVFNNPELLQGGQS